jgi:hypothetical protein
MSARFEPVTIWRGPPAERPTCVAADIDGDGDDEFVIATRRPEKTLHWFDREPSGSWTEHLMDGEAPPLGVGGAFADLTGDGRLDFIAGTDDRSNFVYWWEQPADTRVPWTRRIAFELPANRTHDALVADINGMPELYIWNQGAETLFHVPLPEDPFETPWPDVREVVTGVDEQGLAVGDVDGDGSPELVAGTSWYKLDGDTWTRHVFTDEYRAPRLAVADFDGDGRAEIALCESDGSGRGETYGRLAHFRPGRDPTARWTAKVLCDDLLDPHTLQVGDFDGDGLPDIYVADMGLGDWTEPHPPTHRLFLNRDGRWDEERFGSGLGAHEAQVLKLDDRTAILCKPYTALDAPGPRATRADELTLFVPTPDR